MSFRNGCRPARKHRGNDLLQRDQDRYETDSKLHLGKNEWHETTLIYRRKEDSEHGDHRQYSVFMTVERVRFCGV